MPPGTCADWSPETAFSVYGSADGRASRVSAEMWGRTVDGDPELVAELLELAARQAEGPQVPEDEMVVRAARLELVAVPDELLTERASVRDDLLGVRLELGRACLEEGGRDRGDGLSYGMCERYGVCGSRG